MKITFLGTGTSQGIPIIGSDHPVCKSDDPRDKRLRVSVLIETEAGTFVIDCGPDFRQQMLTHNVDRMDALLFTHEHADHTAGLDDIRPFYFRQGDIPIFAHTRVLQQLERRFDYIFETKNKYPGAPSVSTYKVINDHPILFQKEQNGPTQEIIPINASHGSLQVFGYRFDEFAYLTDIKTIADKEIEKLQGLEVLVLNALREESHYSHLNVEEALNLVSKIQPKKTYFTHISHHLGFHAEVDSQLPSGVHLAYDGLQLTL
ncbi:MBL fold metallo-hydrolase [Croceiramulus getboli]|nr:MBL fold metallo-hydrolase [Flavobacteriaceae bacterium YJPT1-3]